MALLCQTHEKYVLHVLEANVSSRLTIVFIPSTAHITFAMCVSICVVLSFRLPNLFIDDVELT